MAELYTLKGWILGYVNYLSLLVGALIGGWWECKMEQQTLEN